MKTVLSFLEDSAVGSVLYVANLEGRRDWPIQLPHFWANIAIYGNHHAIALCETWCSPLNQFRTVPSSHFTWNSIYVTLISGSDGSPATWKNVMPHIGESIF